MHIQHKIKKKKKTAGSNIDIPPYIFTMFAEEKNILVAPVCLSYPNLIVFVCISLLFIKSLLFFFVFDGRETKTSSRKIMVVMFSPIKV